MNLYNILEIKYIFRSRYPNTIYVYYKLHLLGPFWNMLLPYGILFLWAPSEFRKSITKSYRADILLREFAITKGFNN